MKDYEYLFEEVSKIPSFVNWLERYNDFYSANPYITVLLWLFISILPLAIALIWFDRRQSDKSKKALPEGYLFTLFFIIISADLSIAGIRNIILKNIEKGLDNEAVTLYELNKHSIDINKLPKWASDNLVNYGYLKYVDIYRGFLDSERDKKRLIEQFWQDNRRYQLEQMKNW